MSKKEKLPVEPYKGVRDFYPEDQSVQNHIFSAMRRAVEAFGYEEMNASILESTELYRTKSSEEIVNEQTYTFLDRGKREVTLRPEMTPSVARMVAARRRELGFPLRWFSIQNFFRYERPQRGRLREFWQLNADLFGISGVEADVEMISVANQVMKELGASDDMFEIRIASRKLLARAYQPILKEGVELIQMYRLLDKREKMPEDKFNAAWKELFKGPFKETSIHESSELSSIMKKSKEQNINVVFSPYTVRGFDYYTDIVFEVFDTNSENPRAMFGGGRYDELIEHYGDESIPAVGFAMGDVVARDFLETHGLLPVFTSPTHVYLAVTSPALAPAAQTLASGLRQQGVNVAIDFGEKKLADQIKTAAKHKIPHLIVVGEKELASDTFTIRDLESGAEEARSKEQLAEFFLAL